MNDYYSGNLSSPFPDHHDNGDTILLMPTSSSSSSSYSSTSSNSNSPPDDGDVIINNDDEFGATSGDHCPVQILLDREYASVILPLLLALRKKTLLKRARIAYCTTLLSTKLANDELDAKR